ncbi:MAG: hypothetical protein AB1589_04540 [Cyanobacteriota bacterium]
MELELKKLLSQPSQKWLNIIIPFKQKSTGAEQVNLHLTIRFNEEWTEPLGRLGGRIKFGLKGGELRLKLQNGKIASREFDSSLPPSVPIDRTLDEHQKTTGMMEFVVPLAAIKQLLKGSTSREQTGGTIDKFLFDSFQITTKDSPEKPAWVFKVKTGEPVLIGSLTDAKLGTIEVAAKPCYVEATFEVSKRDVQLTDSEGLWLKDLIPEKREALDIALVKLLLKHKIKPYLSRVELQYV